MTATEPRQFANNPSKIQLARISHAYFEHPDLTTFADFAKDFGFVQVPHEDDNTVLYRGYGNDQYCYVARKASGQPKFQGSAFIAQSQSEFDKAARIEGAVVDSLKGFPGGGNRVALRSPAGFLIHVIYGQQDRETSTQPVSSQVEHLGPYNRTHAKPRLGEFQRFHAGPAMVHKLGHYGCAVQDFEKELNWYTDNFNFVPSDIQHLPDNESVNVIAFMHLDLGKEYSDHHTLFIARLPPGEHDRMHHSSYEVEDFDTQILGHEWLAKKGYRSVWGVGRHILGSQIFDYWRDTSGFTIEHYADGDLVNVDIPTKRTPAGPLAIWGPEIPSDFQADGTQDVKGPE